MSISLLLHVKFKKRPTVALSSLRFKGYHADPPPLRHQQIIIQIVLFTHLTVAYRLSADRVTWPLLGDFHGETQFKYITYIML